MHAAMSSVLNLVFGNEPVPRADTEAAFSAIMDGECSEIEIAALLTALRVRGESYEEIAGAAHCMRQRVTRISCRQTGLLDTCGTGGDQLHTFNISTAAAFVAAGAGVPVAKHGNRSVSSSSGSADVLEALGVNLQLSPEQVGTCIDDVGIGFCFAPLLHSAMRNVVPVRKALGFRTIFNLLGPLTNPAGADFQLLGANRIHFAEKLSAALAELGTDRALVVCGNDELDEVALWGETTVFDVSRGQVTRSTWTAASFNLPECNAGDLVVQSSAASADVIRAVLAGEPGPAQNIVIANAAASLIAAGRADAPEQAASLAQAAIHDGHARMCLDRLVQMTQKWAG